MIVFNSDGVTLISERGRTSKETLEGRFIQTLTEKNNWVCLYVTFCNIL